MGRIPLVSDLLEEIDGALQYADPRTKHWFMLWGTPVPVWILTLLYLSFVFLGPRYMKNRQPYTLYGPMLAYNILLIFLSLYMSIEILLSIHAAGYNWICAPYNKDTWKNPLELRVAEVLWLYGVSKVIELMDTVMMILRKKNEQVTFLHVFHHAIMVNIWWFVPTFIPGGQTWFGAWLNCVVHVVMYTYYALAAIPSLRQKLWWKRYLTRFQLIQFCTTLTHTVQTYFTGCDFPMWGQVVLFSFMITMLILFGNFYLQAYIKRSKQAKKLEQNGYTKDSVGTNGVTHSNGTVDTNSYQSLRHRQH